MKRNDTYARAVAQAGRARLATLDTAEVANFMAELLRGYSKLQKFTAAAAVSTVAEGKSGRPAQTLRVWLPTTSASL